MNTLPPQPTGVVPFIDASEFATRNEGPIPPQDQNSFSTTSEAEEMVSAYKAMIAAIPGAVCNIGISEKAQDLGYALKTPFNPNFPDSVGVLVITGSITIDIQPVIQGAPVPSPISGPISDLVGDIYARQWKPNQEERDRNYVQSGGATNVNTPVAGKLALAYLADTQSFEAYWVAAE